MRALARLKSAEAESTLEFAVVAALLILLMFGVLEGGRVFSSWEIITNEAREGARWGAVRVGDPDYANPMVLQAAVEEYVISRTARLVNQNPEVFSVTATAEDADVTVRIDYRMDAITPLIASIRPTFQLTAVSTMYSEGD